MHPCLPLGLGPADHATVHSWNVADRLLLYTDGLIEARDKTGAFLSSARIETALRAPDASACLEQLLHAVHSHAGRFDDDLALLLMTRGTEPGIPTP